MPRRKWSATNKRRSRIMVKLIDEKLLERRIMRNLERLNIRVILYSIHSDDGNPSIANIKQALRQLSNTNSSSKCISPISQQPQAEFPQLDYGLAIPSFLLGDDLIACLNKAMAFMSTVMASRFPLTNNQLRTSSNPRNQATIQDGMVTVQQVKGRQAFLADPVVADGQATQTTITHNVAFQTDDLDAYDSDCDDISSAKAVLMANLSSYDSDVLSEVPNFDTHQTDDMTNQSVQEMQYFEQTPIDDYPDNEITSVSNIISYSQYLYEKQNAVVLDTNSSAPQDAMIISMFEQMLIK
ncbi:hypothetical protein Tco_1201030 [Tanacetum coccineum]